MERIIPPANTDSPEGRKTLFQNTNTNRPINPYTTEGTC